MIASFFLAVHTYETKLQKIYIAVYQGILGAALGLATIVGPILGGFLADQHQWRYTAPCNDCACQMTPTYCL